MAAPTYLTPRYITLDMVRLDLAAASIRITEDDTVGAPGLYVGLANDLLAEGESYIVKQILSDYLYIPLQTDDYTGDVNTSNFNDLASKPQFVDTYITLRDQFKAAGLWRIYNQYYSQSGQSNGEELMRGQIMIIKTFKSRLDEHRKNGNATSIRNAFSGLKLADNALSRSMITTDSPDIPTGDDQVWSTFTGLPNYRYTNTDGAGSIL